MAQFIDDIPLTDFKATVKYYRPNFANPLGKFVMKETFPAFYPDKETFESEFWHKIEEENLRRHQYVINNLIDEHGLINGIEHPRVFHIDGTIRRRFAGDFTHSRDSYYSVCNDEYGNDKGTLKQEICAYLLPDINDQIVVHDLEIPRDLELLSKHIKAPTGFVIELLNSNERPNPVLLKLRKANLISELPTKPMLIYMPLEVKSLEVPKVFDLRLLETQCWLYRFLPMGNQILTMPKARKLDSFCEMLPSLMFPDRGGNDITDSIGFLLRKTGVNGLVFPSARCDVGCEFRNGKLNDYLGWNFLDYRNSGDILAGTRTDYSQWNNPEDLGDGVICRLAPDNSPFKNSWRIEGLETSMKETLSHFLPAQNEIISNLPLGYLNK